MMIDNNYSILNLMICMIKQYNKINIIKCKKYLIFLNKNLNAIVQIIYYNQR